MPKHQLLDEIRRELKRLSGRKTKTRGQVNLKYLGMSDLESFLETLRGMK